MAESVQLLTFVFVDCQFVRKHLLNILKENDSYFPDFTSCHLLGCSIFYQKGLYLQR